MAASATIGPPLKGEEMMATTDTHKVMPHKDGGWQVKRDGGKRASRRAPTKEEAERLARVISGNQETELIVATKDGSMERRDSHGNDPKGRG